MTKFYACRVHVRRMKNMRMSRILYSATGERNVLFLMGHFIHVAGDNIKRRRT